MSQQKATGWKVPLLFCAVMGVAVLGTWLWRNLGKPEVPPLEPGLVAVAQTYHIDLEADPEGKLLPTMTSQNSSIWHFIHDVSCYNTSITQSSNRVSTICFKQCPNITTTKSITNI